MALNPARENTDNCSKMLCNLWIWASAASLCLWWCDSGSERAADCCWLSDRSWRELTASLAWRGAVWLGPAGHSSADWRREHHLLLGLLNHRAKTSASTLGCRGDWRSPQGQMDCHTHGCLSWKMVDVDQASLGPSRSVDICTAARTVPAANEGSKHCSERWKKVISTWGCCLPW